MTIVMRLMSIEGNKIPLRPSDIVGFRKLGEVNRQEVSAVILQDHCEIAVFGPVDELKVLWQMGLIAERSGVN